MHPGNVIPVMSEQVLDGARRALPTSYFVGAPRVEFKVLDDRLRPGGPWPLEPATRGAAGLDVRACLTKPLRLFPGQCELVPLGFALSLAETPWVAAVLLPRSGLGHKHGIVLGNLVGLIDSDYQGPLMASVWNRNHEGPYFEIGPGDRVGQLVFVPVLHPQLVLVDEFSVVTERGAGGFGSTGRGVGDERG